MDNAPKESKYKFGLIGKDIDYSFSRGYFAKKFHAENLPHTYVNFDLQNISQFPSVITNSDNLKGLNVTIPYKEAVIPHLDKLNKRAKKIGAVNTIKISKKGKLIGYNTDYHGFKNSLQPHLKKHHKKALIFGTGGASKAIAYVLSKLGIDYYFVSRSKKEGVTYTYSDLTDTIIQKHLVLINCSPVGTFPNINECPDIPYGGITHNHILYDLIYNPEETKFLNIGAYKNAKTINGLKMLELQAEKSWAIWNS
ncbi:shikimate dehydrogenase [Winogradskyella wandonensis]|uniref:Shikimate dehydrogenase n=1 Tax=Winogradskyella wandonensis TaxID=1442586 RepID=A0A4R1KNU8_9FLAO|nr:shikimate dehydrogenase [Winogradskyella wandonensis]TCK66725.1 shikimate dehydrogenase [Winogradskyella wandonensis]